MKKLLLLSGFYGKIPSQGDFIKRGMTMKFTEPWCKWIQNGFYHSREQLNDTWKEHYLNSPIWHFVFTSPLYDNLWLGLMMPSTDQIGRYFPLMIAIPLPKQTPISALGDSAVLNCLIQAEQLALSTREASLTLNLDDFNRQILKLSLSLYYLWERYHNPFFRLKSFLAKAFSNHGEMTKQNAWQIPLSKTEDLPEYYQNAEKYLQESQWETYSLWWTINSSSFPNRFLGCKGFPPADKFAALLDGQWERWGWELPSAGERK